MAFLPTAALALLAASACNAALTVQRLDVAPSAAAASSIPVSEYYLPLTGKTTRKGAKTAARAALVQHLAAPNKTFVGPITGAGDDEEYTSAITIGGQKFQVIVDTGSSDTWLAQKGFKCFNLTSYPEPEAECSFGSAGFSPSKSKTFKTDTSRNFNISYGDGEFLTGTVGFDTVTVANLSVTHQEIGVVTNAAWSGDDFTTGLLGLAYPGLTSVYKGSNPDNDSQNNSEPYNPFFFSAVNQSRVAPFFSVALNRGSISAEENSTSDPHLGYIAFGGIAPVKVTNTNVTVPIQPYAVASSNKPQYFFYTVDVQAFVFPGSAKLSTNSSNVILDTGTTLLYAPTNVANAVAAAFRPRGQYSDEIGAVVVACNATAPPFSVQIGGKQFAVTGKDLILPIGTDERGREVCISGVVDGGAATPDNIFILGDVFLHNVVATFHTVANTVTLTERAAY